MKLGNTVFMAAVLFLCGMVAFSGSPASAKGEKNRGHQEQPAKASENNKSKEDDMPLATDTGNARITIRIGDEDQAIIRQYLNSHYRPNCPPGLAKKNNGCLPPGIAKKYNVGERLDQPYGEIPDDLRALLGSLPPGYQYVQVDKDILLISEAGKKILDAVTLLSALD